MRHWLRLPREVEAPFLAGGGFEQADVAEGVSLHGRGDGTKPLRTLPTQSIPSFHASVIRYEMYNRQSRSLLSSPKRYGRPDPCNQHTRDVLSCSCRGQSQAVWEALCYPAWFPRCCFRSHGTCFMLASLGCVPWF